MTYFATLAAGIALATSVVAQAPKPAAAVAALQGTWIVASINGQTSPEGTPELTLTFAGDKYHQALGGDVNERGTIKIDAAKKPMTIDLNIAEGSDAGKMQLGIFEVAGDTLRICLDQAGAGQRPSTFDAKEPAISVVAKRK